ncbi:MAG: sulfite exporter TauE/SafE family protein [Clostridiaceae bacterium]|nr:sulfite exporter TauE/SafE family protein [Clostridiaceae bacterium]
MPKTSLESENSLKYALSSDKKRRLIAVLIAVAGLAVGFVNGYFGAGGGMLLVPALTLIGKLEEKKAHATAIAVILPLSLISGIIYVASGGLNGAPSLPVIGGAVIGGIVGALLLNKLNNRALAAVFYIVMIAVGVKTLMG